MVDGFYIGGTLDNSFSRLLPIANRPFIEPRFRIVMCQQLRLCLNRFGKLSLQNVCDTAVILLPRATQQGLIGGVLDEGMLIN